MSATAEKPAALADWRVAALLAALLALLWTGPVQPQPPVGWVDPGLYLYWFLNPAENQALRGGDYHGARLGFVLPGAILHALFGLVTAQALLVSLFHLMGLLAVNAIAATVLRGFAARAALLVFVGLNPVWLAAMTRGYVDGPSIAWALAALAVLLRCPAGGAGWRGFAAGALLAMAFFSHPFGGGLGALAIAGLLLRAASPLALAGVALRLGTGALAAVAVLALGAMALGMPWLFFGASLARMMQGLATVGTTPFHVPLSDWIAEAPRVMLYPLAAVLLAGGGWMARRAGRQVLALGAAGLLPLAALLASLAVWSSFVLQFNFYASYVWIALVPALALFARGLEQRGAGLAPWLGIALGAIACFALALLLPLEARQEGAASRAGWALILLAMAAGLVLLGLRRAVLALPALLLAGSLAGAMNRDTATVLHLPGGADLAAKQVATERMLAFLEEAGWRGGRYLIWLDRDRFTAARGLPPSHLYTLDYAGTRLRLNALDSLGASLGWDVAAIGFNMPGLEGVLGERGNLGQLDEGTERLIALCAEPADCEAALGTLRARGLAVAPGPRREIEVAGMPRFTILLATLRPAPAREVAAAQAELALRRLHPEAGDLRLEGVECLPAGPLLSCRTAFRLDDGSAWLQVLLFEPVGPARILAQARDKVPALLPAPGGAADPAQVTAMLRAMEPAAGLRVEAVDCAAAGPLLACRAGFVLGDGSAWMRLLFLEQAGPALILSQARDRVPALIARAGQPPDPAQVAAILRRIEPEARGIRLLDPLCPASGPMRLCQAGFSLADGSAWSRAMWFEMVGNLALFSSARDRQRAGAR